MTSLARDDVALVSIKVEEESIDLIVECNHQVDTIGEFDRKYNVLGSSASGNGT